MKLLEDQIKKLQNDINKNIDYINNGGCIHFSYFFSKRLRELNIKHKVAFHDYDKISLSYNKFNSVFHVTIYIENIGFIDGNVINKKNNYTYIRKISNISLIKLNSFRNDYKWNNTYNTKQNNKLELLINKYIK